MKNMNEDENSDRWAVGPEPPSHLKVAARDVVAPAPEQTKYNPEDPWSLPEIVQSGVAWNELNSKQKTRRLFVNGLKIGSLLCLLYLFVCSLSFLASAFKLLGGKNAGTIFQQSEVLSNPIAGLMIGILSTVMVQSSSTSTSIVVTMVASELLSIEQAVYIIMGANIGTSVTNTIVALFHSTDKHQFRRAFAAATVHDMFNWLCVFCLLPLEFILQKTTGKGYLVWLSGLMVGERRSLEQRNNPQFLEVITKPFTNVIIRVDKNLIKQIATANASQEGLFKNSTLVKHWCVNKATKEITWCRFLLNIDAQDSVIGITLLVLSLLILCTCLILIVKVLRSLLQGSVAKILRKTVNSHFPKPFSCLTGYLAILVGAILTFLVQSSSIFTSALTPLVAIGVLTLERTFPLTLGANIGTTGTALLAALANSEHIHDALQIALCHLLFNVTGILIWYPIPILRAVPIDLAKALGTLTAEYRWFAVVYIFLMFLVFPALVFGLSMAGWIVMVISLALIIAFFITIAIVNVLQRKMSQFLPKFLRDWTFLPAPLRSLQPYDEFFLSIFNKCCMPICLKLNICKSCLNQDTHQVKSLAKTDYQESSQATIISRV